MRKTIIPILTFITLATAGCQSSDSTQEMLQDENERRELLTAILENEQARDEMVDMMRERNMGGPMGQAGMSNGNGMVGDTTGMAAMNRKQVQVHMQQIMTLCETDSAACNTMADMMMQNRAMMGSMMQNMQRRGKIDNGCLQMMMRQVGP